MKIVVFAPHPDDEIYGCGGSILKWLDHGHDVHIIYVTDNRALISWGKKEDQLLEEKAEKFIGLSQDEIAEIALKEATNVAHEFGLPDENIHLFKIHDQDAENQIDLGVDLAKPIINDADRIVLPSDNNNHNDHQATHTMGKKAAKELELKNTEFYVYAIYNVLKVPREMQAKIKMKDYREQLYELMKGYKTQLALKDTRIGWKTLKRKRTERFGVFSFENMNKYENF
ncbi:MAG: PIG-L deacetylase family protein [Promethearchaeia archaeon]